VLTPLRKVGKARHGKTARSILADVSPAAFIIPHN
jgi:hypothetical protein